jgi:hypothetical protein
MGGSMSEIRGLLESILEFPRHIDFLTGDGYVRLEDVIKAIGEIEGCKPSEPNDKSIYQISLAEGSLKRVWLDVSEDVYADAGLYPEYKRRFFYRGVGEND